MRNKNNRDRNFAQFLLDKSPMVEPRHNPIAGKLRLQRLALWVERLWPLLQRPLMVLGLALAVMWSGVFAYLPKGLPLVILLGLIALLVWSLKPFLNFTAPSHHAAARRLEQNSDLSHRAASSLEDELVKGAGSDELWQAHVERNLASLKTLHVAQPRSNWRAFDPLALRLPIVMAAITAFILGGGELKSNFLNAFHFGPAAVAKSAILDAWVKPPSYTGKPPLLLTSPAMQEKLTANPELNVPENAGISLRLQGAAKPRLLLLSPGSKDQTVALADLKQEDKDGAFTVEAKLDRPATIKVLDGDQVLADWNIALISDQPPKIEFVEEPKGDSHGKLSVKWHASDDYGVKNISAEINLSDQQDKSDGFAGNGVFLYPAPEFKISMAKPNAKDDTETSLADLASHPWAGLWAEMTLTATDAAGHKTTSAPKRFKMAQRDFVMPFARALDEQRKRFILSPDAAPDAATMINAMLLYPFELKGRMGLNINLARVNAQLFNASHPDDVVAVTKNLWPLIVSVDDGNLADSKTRLKQLADQLRQALREGAPKDKIAELMKKLQDEMNKLAEKMQKDGQQKQAEQGQQKDQGQVQTITPEQLQSMLDEIDKLTKEGNTDKAQELLSQLDEMLQNLQPGDGQSAEGGQPGQDQMDGLNGLLGKQQKLMDETQRLGQNEKGKEGQGDQPGDLADKQKGLRGQLGKMGKGLGSAEGGDKFSEAEKNMGDAEDALRRGNKDEALRQQNKALRNMMQGMNKLAEKMDKDGKGKGQGRGNQQGQGNGRANDPLGRPQGPRRPDVGDNRNVLPKDAARKRSGDILKELRDRANEQGLDSETRGYIDGLLKGLD